MHNFPIVLKYYYIIVVKIDICKDLAIFSACWILFVSKKVILYYIWKIAKLAKVVLEMWFTLQKTVEIYFPFLCILNYPTDFTLLIILHILLLLFEYLQKLPGNLLQKDHVVRKINEEFSQNSLKKSKIASRNNH